VSSNGTVAEREDDVVSEWGMGAFGYQDRRAVLTSKHDKLALIAPAMAAGVGLAVDVVEADTDVLGTFTGDVERSGTPWETAVAKARLGMRIADCALGMASEGSIGPDSSLPFVVSAVELVVFVDDERGIVLGESERSFDIVAVADEVAPGDDLDDLLRNGGFPSHAMAVRPASAGAGAKGGPIFKGVVARAELERAIRSCADASPHGRARVETDLRAQCCPSRRPIIARAAERLAARMASTCPECATPGWGMIRFEFGLPCEWCGREVHLPRAEVLGCVSCLATQVAPTALTSVDPRHCEWCNP
jgi:hypothetical protein